MILSAQLISLYLVSLLAIGWVFSKLNLLDNEVIARSSPIDALRGILATSVVCTHFIITYHWKVTGNWVRPEQDVLNNMGVIPVSLFFMITGFLFFSKIYQRDTDFKKLWRSRFYRIVPLYVFVVALVFLISAKNTDFTLSENAKISKEIWKWIVFKGSTVNAFADSTKIIAGVHWTLRYEWLFYISLPIIACLINRKNYGWPVFLAIIIIMNSLHSLNEKLFLLFLLGFIPSLIKEHAPHLMPWMKSRTATLLSLFMLISAMSIHDGYSLIQMLLLAFPFACIALGNDLFGILRTTGLKALGEVSYSIYLTHGLVLYTVFSIFQTYNFSAHTPEQYTFLLPVILSLAALFSIATFLAIEKPFIQYSKKAQRVPGFREAVK